MSQDYIEIGGYLRYGNEPICSRHLSTLNKYTRQIPIKGTISDFHISIENALQEILDKVIDDATDDYLDSDYVVFEAVYTYAGKILTATLPNEYLYDELSSFTCKNYLYTRCLYTFVEVSKMEGVFIDNLVAHINNRDILPTEFHPRWITDSVLKVLLARDNISEFNPELFTGVEQTEYYVKECIKHRYIEALSLMYRVHVKRRFEQGFNDEFSIKKEIELHNRIKDMQLSEDELLQLYKPIITDRYSCFIISYMCYYGILDGYHITKFRIGLKVKDYVSALVCANYINDDKMLPMVMNRAVGLMKSMKLNRAFILINQFYQEDGISKLSFEVLLDDILVDGIKYHKGSKIIKVFNDNRKNQFDVMFDNFMWLHDLHEINSTPILTLRYAANILASGY